MTSAPLRPRARSLFVAAVAASLSSLACPGTLDPSLQGGGGTPGTAGTGGVQVCDAVTLMAGQRCGMVGCHGSSSPQGIDLMSPGVIARLLNVNSTSDMCSGKPYLNMGSNPATGLLIDKIKPSPPCGVIMPYAGFGGDLTPQELSCIQDWSTAVTTGQIH